jgi:hypothetical protein
MQCDVTGKDGNYDMTQLLTPNASIKSQNLPRVRCPLTGLNPGL